MFLFGILPSYVLLRVTLCVVTVSCSRAKQYFAKFKLHVRKPSHNSRVKLNHRINHYPLDNAIDFSNTHLMDSDSSMESAIHLLTRARPLSKNNAINAIRRLERKQKNYSKAVEFAYYSFFFIYLELKR